MVSSTALLPFSYETPYAESERHHAKKRSPDELGDTTTNKNDLQDPYPHQQVSQKRRRSLFDLVMSTATSIKPSPKPNGLKVIALISGGKDSLYSMLHCQENGHEIVALANLRPPLVVKKEQGQGGEEEEQVDDMDSEMYQTVGHNVVPLFEEALGLPLYREEILGSAVNRGKEYGVEDGNGDVEMSNSNKENASVEQEELAEARAGELDVQSDEAEDLLRLLKKVCSAHPEAQAVSTGAIYSHYQRNRVESVVIRLGLIPLAYLWQYPKLPRHEPLLPFISNIQENVTLEETLLSDMANAGQVSKIVKVSSGGLDDWFIDRDVGDPITRRTMMAKIRRYDPTDGSVLGEGGEYETLAVDGPTPLWKKRILLHDARVVSHGGEVYTLSVRRPEVRPKETARDLAQPIYRLNVPRLLDAKMERILGLLPKDSRNAQDSKPYEASRPTFPDVEEGSIRRGEHSVIISNIRAPTAGPEADSQMHSILKILSTRMGGDASYNDVVQSTLLVRSMADFEAINRVYTKFFRLPIPPTRVTIACGDLLPDGCQIVATFEISKVLRHLRQGLHVQSRSYWAPANIGPYSQAIECPFKEQGRWGNSTEYSDASSTGSLVYIAGQIPLVPCTMDFDEVSTHDDKGLEGSDPKFHRQTVLSLQHLRRIGQAMGVQWFLGGVAFFTANNRVEASNRADVAWHAWRYLHYPKSRWDEIQEPADSPDDLEVDQSDSGEVNQFSDTVNEDTRPDLADYDPGNPLPSMTRHSYSSDMAGKDLTAPFFAAEVDDLPRKSQIEWHGLGSKKTDALHETKDDTDVEDPAFTSVKRCGAISSFGPQTVYFGIRADLVGKKSNNEGDPISIQEICDSTLRDIWDIERFGENGNVPIASLTVYETACNLDLESSLNTLRAKSKPQGQRGHENDIAMQIIPCKSLWGPDTKTGGGLVQLAVGFAIRKDTRAFMRALAERGRPSPMLRLLHDEEERERVGGEMRRNAMVSRGGRTFATTQRGSGGKD